MRSTGLSAIASRLEASLRVQLVLIAICLPLSVRIYFSSIDLELIFPAEPLLAFFSLSLISVALLRAPWSRLGELIKRPLVLASTAWMALLAASVLASEYPLVSLKALTVRMAFFGAFFLLPLLVPVLTAVAVRRALVAHAFSFAVVAGYSMVMHFDKGFGRLGAGLAPFPFYVDHTSYSAAAVFVLLTLSGELARFKKPWTRPHLITLTIFIAAAVVLSFSRGAWLSLIAAVAALILLKWEWRTAWRLTAVGSVLAIVAGAWVLSGKAPVLADSNSDGAGFKESVLSLSNHQGDASNMERINRWKCSLRMSRDRPWLGHGVGAFQFVFPPYQRPEEMTYISVMAPIPVHRVQRYWTWSDDLIIRNNPQNLYCSGGTAHSEYLLALAESGPLAMVLFAFLGMVVLREGHRAIRARGNGAARTRLITVWLALLAYFTHALFNNFLDDPKVAFPFWSGMLLLVMAIKANLPAGSTPAAPRTNQAGMPTGSGS